MKKTVLLLLLAFTFGCNKDYNNNNTTTNPIGQLLPATQVGANKTGCLLDGKVFLPLKYTPSNASAAYIFNLTERFTSTTHTGKTRITKLTNQIVLGNILV